MASLSFSPAVPLRPITFLTSLTKVPLRSFRCVCCVGWKPRFSLTQGVSSYSGCRRGFCPRGGCATLSNRATASRTPAEHRLIIGRESAGSRPNIARNFWQILRKIARSSAGDPRPCPGSVRAPGSFMTAARAIGRFLPDLWTPAVL